MNDLIAISLIAMKVFFESSFLIIIFYGILAISTSLYYHWRGLNLADSITAGLMAILSVTGLIFFLIGALFISDPNSFIVSDNSSNLNKNISDISSNGWGLVGFGIAILSLSYSFLGNIETQRNVAMIKVLLFRGKRYTKTFQESLNWKQVLVISLIWLIGALLILIYNLTYNPWLSIKNAWLLIIPTILAYLMLGFGFACLLWGLSKKFRFGRQAIIKKIRLILNYLRKKIIKYCICCYLFPDHFPELFEN